MTIAPQSHSAEDLEGLPSTEDVSLGEYPLDTMLIRTENRTIFDILRKIDTTFKLDPDFQREFVWDAARQSRLIESVLMRIPLPVFYFAEDKAGTLIVVDGLQRLTTFIRFHKNEFKLVLPGQPNLDKKRFADLPPKLQNRFEDCNLTLYVIDSKLPERARLDIFDRVNSGVPLTRQQMRNSLYMGPATRFLRDESQTEIFMAATGNSLRTDNMRDREVVNRFCAFHLLELDSYRQDDLDEFLARALVSMNGQSDDLEKVSIAFRRALANNYAVFDRHAFRKHDAYSTERKPLNVSLWDAMITALCDVDEQLVLERRAKIKESFYQLMHDSKFIDSITYSTTNRPKVKYRIETARALIGEALR